MDIEKKEQETEEKKKAVKSESYKLETSKLNFSDGITVYEGKMAVLILGALVTLIFALVMYFFRNDISNNLTSIVETFILCIAGITTAEATLTAVKDKGIFGIGGKK